jgi:hypothetical protein
MARWATSHSSRIDLGNRAYGRSCIWDFFDRCEGMRFKNARVRACLKSFECWTVNVSRPWYPVVCCEFIIVPLPSRGSQRRASSFRINSIASYVGVNVGISAKFTSYYFMISKRRNVVSKSRRKNMNRFCQSS